MKIFALWMAVLASLVTIPVHGADWLTDLPAAQARAKAENKMVLLNFTGSDWCGWCIKLKEEVFSKPEFEKYAAQNLVLFEADFPKRKMQVRVRREGNEALMEQFQVEGFPTIVLLNQNGLKLGSLGYEPGGAANYVERLKKISQNKQGTATAPLPPKSGTPTTPSMVVKAGELTLKGISGPKEKRLALINDQTFAEGEAGIVNCGDRREKIRCVEIRDKSVVVMVSPGGERKELRLREAL